MIINGKQVKNIFHNGKQVQKVIRNGVTLCSGQHPNMVGRWSARSKTNSDADRDILKDLSGNERDIVLKNFAFTVDSGYENPLYPGGLVFDGVDDYGACATFPALDDFTIICKRTFLQETNKGCILSNKAAAENGAFFFESLNSTSVRSYNAISFVSKFADNMAYMTPTRYMSKVITRGSALPNVGISLMNMLVNSVSEPVHGVIYDLIIYNKTLAEQEIQSEILKYNL